MGLRDSVKEIHRDRMRDKETKRGSKEQAQEGRCRREHSTVSQLSVNEPGEKSLCRGWTGDTFPGRVAPVALPNW